MKLLHPLPPSRVPKQFEGGKRKDKRKTSKLLNGRDDKDYNSLSSQVKLKGLTVEGNGNRKFIGRTLIFKVL